MRYYIIQPLIIIFIVHFHNPMVISICNPYPAGIIQLNTPGVIQFIRFNQTLPLTT